MSFIVYEEVTSYETKDGVLHTDPKDAENHVIRKIQDMIGPIIDSSKIPIKYRLDVMSVLFGDIDRAARIFSILDKYL